MTNINEMMKSIEVNGKVVSCEIKPAAYKDTYTATKSINGSVYGVIISCGSLDQTKEAVNEFMELQQQFKAEASPAPAATSTDNNKPFDRNPYGLTTCSKAYEAEDREYYLELAHEQYKNIKKMKAHLAKIAGLCITAGIATSRCREHIAIERRINIADWQLSITCTGGDRRCNLKNGGGYRELFLLEAEQHMVNKKASAATLESLGAKKEVSAPLVSENVLAELEA